MINVEKILKEFDMVANALILVVLFLIVFLVPPETCFTHDELTEMGVSLQTDHQE